MDRRHLPKPAFGKSPIAQISAQEFLPLLKRIEEHGKSETAHRVRALASRVFCYAHATGRAPQGAVTVSLRDALAPAVVVHHAAITEPEKVGELLLAIDGYTGLPDYLDELREAARARKSRRRRMEPSFSIVEDSVA